MNSAGDRLVDLQVAGSVAYEPKIAGVENLFICENDALEELLFNRRKVGLEFVRLCRQISQLFLAHLRPVLSNSNEEISELMVLTKGYYYWLHNAYEATYGRNLPINFVATNRASVSEQGVAVNVHFTNFDAATKTLLIGDTIASGETICAALTSYVHHHSLQRVILLSYAGSVVGAQRISAFCKLHDIQAIFLFGLAAFGLAQNGFDLSFLHNQTVSAPRYLERARSNYQEKGISVAGWDFGSQAQAPDKYRHLSRIEANYWDLPTSPLFPPPAGAIDEALVTKERAAFEARFPSLKKIR